MDLRQTSATFALISFRLHPWYQPEQNWIQLISNRIQKCLKNKNTRKKQQEAEFQRAKTIFISKLSVVSCFVFIMFVLLL